jgi:hypothetical protein
MNSDTNALNTPLKASTVKGVSTFCSSVDHACISTWCIEKGACLARLVIVWLCFRNPTCSVNEHQDGTGEVYTLTVGITS